LGFDAMVMLKQNLVIALVGNPNAGKTSLFNALVGAKQHVANYPGVTVEKKEGVTNYKNFKLTFVDLPGAYSLTAYSIEERITRDFIIKEKPDVVLNIIDSSNIERNLYLTIQLLELGAPIVLCLNMFDELEKRGLEINCKRLS